MKIIFIFSCSGMFRYVHRYVPGFMDALTEMLSLRVFFFFLPSYILHVSTHFEKSQRLRILWTIWNFSMISAEKVSGSFDFCHHRGVDFASEAPRAKAMT